MSHQIQSNKSQKTSEGINKTQEDHFLFQKVMEKFLEEKKQEKKGRGKGRWKGRGKGRGEK